MSFPGPLATSTTSASAMRWSPFSEISSTWQSIHPAAPTRTGSPDGVRSVFTFLNEPSTRLSATPSIPSARNETANDFDSRTFARVRLSSERANATNGGLNEVCISQVPNIKWSAPSFVFVPTMYAPYGIICRTFFFAFLSILSPSFRFVLDGILDAERAERLLPLDARRAHPAVEVAVPVAGTRELERDLQLEPHPHDIHL